MEGTGQQQWSDYIGQFNWQNSQFGQHGTSNSSYEIIASPDFVDGEDYEEVDPALDSGDTYGESPTTYHHSSIGPIPHMNVYQQGALSSSQPFSMANSLKTNHASSSYASGHNQNSPVVIDDTREAAWDARSHKSTPPQEIPEVEETNLKTQSNNNVAILPSNASANTLMGGTEANKAYAYFSTSPAIVEMTNTHTNQKRRKSMIKWFTDFFLDHKIDLTKKNKLTVALFNFEEENKRPAWSYNILCNLQMLFRAHDVRKRNSIIRELHILLREKRGWAKRMPDRLASDDIVNLYHCIRRGHIILEDDVPEDQIEVEEVDRTIPPRFRRISPSSAVPGISSPEPPTTTPQPCTAAPQPVTTPHLCHNAERQNPHPPFPAQAVTSNLNRPTVNFNLVQPKLESQQQSQQKSFADLLAKSEFKSLSQWVITTAMERDEQRQKKKRARGEKDELERELKKARTDLNQAHARDNKDEMERELEKARADLDQARAERDAAYGERDAACAERDTIREEASEWQAKYDTLRAFVDD